MQKRAVNTRWRLDIRRRPFDPFDVDDEDEFEIEFLGFEDKEGRRTRIRCLRA